MPLYHIALTCNDQRAVIAVDHVLEEYGISEQEFVSTWLVDRPEVQGDGDTFEEAIHELFENLKVYNHHADIGDLANAPLLELRHQWAKSLKSSREKFRTPIIGAG